MILDAHIALNAVALYRGIADIYISRGQTIARKWPTYRPRPPTPGQTKTQNYLKQTHHVLHNQTPEFHALFTSNSIPQGRSREDIKRKITLWALNQECYSPPPIILAWSQSVNHDLISSSLSVYYQSVLDFVPSAWSFKYTTCNVPSTQTWWITIGAKRKRAGATETKVEPSVISYRSPLSILPDVVHNKFIIQIQTTETVTSIIPYHV